MPAALLGSETEHYPSISVEVLSVSPLARSLARLARLALVVTPQPTRTLRAHTHESKMEAAEPRETKPRRKWTKGSEATARASVASLAFVYMFGKVVMTKKMQLAFI